MNFEALVDKEVVVWARTGESFLLCTEQKGGGIAPLVTADDRGAADLQRVPFLVGTVVKLAEGVCAIRYRMPDGNHFLALLNSDVVSTITYSDPRNSSGMLIGV